MTEYDARAVQSDIKNRYRALLNELEAAGVDRQQWLILAASSSSREADLPDDENYVMIGVDYLVVDSQLKRAAMESDAASQRRYSDVIEYIENEAAEAIVVHDVPLFVEATLQGGW